MPDSPYRSILLFGAPGTGKGTQGAILGNIPGFFHLSSGDMFRALDRDSELGEEFFKYSSQGLLVPDEFTVKLWAAHTRGLVESGAFDPATSVLVLDGIPRTPRQCDLMRGQIEVMKIIHLAIADRDELVERLKKRAHSSGRPDDASEDVVRRRLEVYEQETTPVLEHYRPADVAEVDAAQQPAEVIRDILGVVAPIQAENFDNPLG